MSLARRSITSITWNVAANSISVAVLFLRSIFLARWLPVDVFGVYALASSIVKLSVRVAGFGMPGAFVHRAPETEDEDQAAAVHFTLRMGFVVVWAVVLIGWTLLFTSGQLQVALLLVIATTMGVQLTVTPKTILLRRVTQRRDAVIQLLITTISTPIVLGIAHLGGTLWALLAIDLVTMTLKIVLFYVWRPVWRPRLAWDPAVMRYFLRFGSRNFVSTMLYAALDRIDDIWAGFFLGKAPLGFYSRAYSFATYPRTILALPINGVVGGIYAELKGNRPRLSQVFFNTNALLVRSSFCLAGLLALVAPEFIRLVLGAKWLPMLDAFRLMLVFTLFDPIKVTVASLVGLSGGKPERVAQARLIQLAVLVAGLFLLGPLFGIAGVALAVDVMLVVGIAILFRQARVFADFSLKRLFAAPGVAMIIGLALAGGAGALPEIAGSDWRTGLVKCVVFLVVYGTILLSLERRQFAEIGAFLGSYLNRKKVQEQSL